MGFHMQLGTGYAVWYIHDRHLKMKPTGKYLNIRVMTEV
jgi:hypothetical protein